MKAILWNNLRQVSTRWHSSGSLLVIAEDLEQARMLLRTTLRSVQEGDPAWDFDAEEDGRPQPSVPVVPAECQAFIEEPTRVLRLADEETPAVFVFPNAGCC